jgi:thioredoxin 1
LVLDAPRPTVVDFSAAWCGPCRSIAPVIEGLASDYAGRVTVATVDIDDNPRLAARYGARSVPTVMLFAGGDVKRVFVGARSAREYRAGVDELLR